MLRNKEGTMWEYKVIESDADSKAEKQLNDAVRGGWELVEFKLRRKNWDEYVFLLRRAR